MGEIRFTWDPGKARANVRKHGISFEEAASVFEDERAIEFYDDENSEEEDRFILLGLSRKLRVLVVCHCEREHGETIRIFSARKATPTERSHYPGANQ